MEIFGAHLCLSFVQCTEEQFLIKIRVLNDAFLTELVNYRNKRPFRGYTIWNLNLYIFTK
jgi:hypothetical protein